MSQVLASARELPQNYSVLVVPTGRTMRICVLSPLVGVMTHFKERSLICPGEGCRACSAGMGRKYAGYVVVHDGSARRLLRLTEQAGLDVERQALAYPGSVWEVTKSRTRWPLSVREVESVQVATEARHSVGDVLIRVALLHGLGLLPDREIVRAQDDFAAQARKVMDGLLIG